MEKELREVYNQIAMGEMPVHEFLAAMQGLLTELVEKEVQAFDECLNYLFQPEIKV